MASDSENVVESKDSGAVRILIVDDDQFICALLSRYMEKEGYRSIVAHNGNDALEIIRREIPDVLIVDYRMPGMLGLEVTENAKKIAPDLPIIVMTAFAEISGAVEAMRKGAYDYLAKPFKREELARVVRGALSGREFAGGQKPLLRKSDGFQGIVGDSEKMKNLFETIERVAACEDGNVLLRGESGTGKELVAKAIHNLTAERSQHNFVPVNCAAIPDDLLESELFGYEKGAFTGANRSKTGRLQLADKGTLFLDEIGDMKPSLQAKLLRVLQEQVFEPIGSVKSTSIDIRVIAATNCDLERLMQEGQFREDLFYRLNVVPITAPPLRERKEDIEPLIAKFLNIYNRGRKGPVLRFTAKAMQSLKAYDWPGNVRELQNMVQRLYILHNGPTVDSDDLPEKLKNLQPVSNDNLAEIVFAENKDLMEKINLVEKMRKNTDQIDIQAMTVEFENCLILQALSQTNWNKKEAAKILNMKRTTLLEKIKRRNLVRKQRTTNLRLD